MISKAIGVLALISTGLFGLGCGQGGGAGVETGCRINDEVSSGVRRDLEKAVSTFFQRARSEEFAPLYAEAASSVKVRNLQDFTGPIAHAGRNIGFPEDLQTEQLIVIGFGPEFPYQASLQCPASGQNQPLTLSLAQFPRQALVVQTGQVRGETIFYSTLWHHENGAWRLAGFFLKPATVLGQRWKAYADLAEAQLQGGNNRNAALLYNIAIELVVPNGWTKPTELSLLERSQARISVTNLPINSVDFWISGADTFRVFNSSYASLPELAVVFRYETAVPLVDREAQEAYAAKLHRYITANFSEYSQVFSSVVLQAVDPGMPNDPWTKIYPLVREQ